MKLLSGRGLRLRLGTTEVLRDVDFSLTEGEMVSIMGPSGSGKSTLLHVLAGILAPDVGEVTLLERPLSSLSESKRSAIRLRRMGFVFQFGDLIPELTMVENVMLPLQLLGASRAQARTRAMELMTELGVDDVADGSAGTVSGGQSQRVAVARALVHRPAIVFADEPTGALDTVAGQVVMDSLVHTATEHGAAIVLVTHDVRVASYAHRNVTLRDGAIANPTAVPA
ncbi:ABC transporter ATP-binding protein [Yimella sp. NH-Cas1]|uniref:ABC transporter ATP-binding protein n=1 Tax=Yimella sp. NH-Cas1 TaxID=2917726 RepID=UPI001EFBFBE7|nr:ABC transporter ATP-binding protein [Yimella sp. NH-Cas1]